MSLVCAFFFEFLTRQKSKLSFSKIDVAYLRLRKRDIVSIYVTLRKHRIFSFIERLLVTYLPKLKPIALLVKNKKAVVSFTIPSYLSFSEIEIESNMSQKVKDPSKATKLHITFVFSNISSKNRHIKPSSIMLQFQYPIYLC